MMSRVLHVVPSLPPPPEGVGGFALALADALAARHGIESRFLVAARMAGRTPEALRVALEEATAEDGARTSVLLHYANYGYAPRGCPAWLVDGLTRWTARRRCRLVTLFHEVWASGPPWTSAFWLRPLQRRLAATLARRSDSLATTLDVYAGMLRPWTAGREIAVLPVFSTVGEPSALPPWGERARRIVVFGGAGVRGRAYGPFLAALARAARELAAEEIWDVGPPLPPPLLPARAGNVPIRPLGVLPAGEVSEILLGSAAGFLAYPPAFLPKSTIFAAYCAHGVLPVCVWNPSVSPVTPAPFWPESGDPKGIPERTARAAHDWYAGHALPIQAERFRNLLAA
jgi:hypothetical protein